MSKIRPSRSMLGSQGLLLLALGCFGCDEVAGDSAQGLQEGVATGDAAITKRDSAVGTLTPRPLSRDGGGLTTMPAPATDAGQTTVDAGQGDAGQDAGVEDAGLVLAADGGSVHPNPTPSNPGCKTLFYRDLDKDGFGDPKASIVSCTQPLGYVLTANDCYDNNDRVHPGATGQFLTNRGDGSFDYDCDGIETPARIKFSVCPSVAGACKPDELNCNDDALRVSWDAAEDGGWTDFRLVPCVGDLCPRDKSKVPACGQAGYWGLSVAWDLLGAKYGCTLPTGGTTRIQTCR